MSKQFRLIALLSIIFSGYALSQTTGFKLNIQAEAHAGEKLKLAYYYGNSFYDLGEISVDKEGNATYSEIEHPGIYGLIFPDDKLYEFMITAPGDYILRCIGDEISVEANPASEAFAVFEAYSGMADRKIDSLRSNEEGPATARRKIKIIRNTSDSLINHLALEHRGNLAGDYFKALQPVKMPDLRSQYPELADSALWLKSMAYYRDHFLDQINWSNPDLYYTPVISEKLDKYLNRVTEQSKEGQLAAIQSLMEKPMHPEMQLFLLKTLFKHYRTSLHKPTHEYAYIYLVENHILKEAPTIFPADLLEEIQKEVEEIKPIALGSKAPEITLPDKDQRPVSLSSLEAKAIIVLFWDFSCPVCRRVVDEFGRTISQYNYKNIKVYTIFTGDDKDIWDAWEVKKLGNNWTNTYLDGHEEILKTYRIEKVPMLFLLNEKREIVDKWFTVRELEGYLEELTY